MTKGAQSLEMDEQLTPTIPAPPSTPTAVPEFDMTQLAAASSWEALLTNASYGHLPLDLAVPVRRNVSADGVPLRAAFLLSHVDDSASILELATMAQLPLAEAIECFTALADLGLVALHGTAPPPGASDSPDSEPRAPRPRSGLRRRL